MEQNRRASESSFVDDYTGMPNPNYDYFIIDISKIERKMTQIIPESPDKKNQYIYDKLDIEESDNGQNYTPNSIKAIDSYYDKFENAIHRFDEAKDGFKKLNSPNNGSPKSKPSDIQEFQLRFDDLRKDLFDFLYYTKDGSKKVEKSATNTANMANSFSCNFFDDYKKS